MEDIFVETSDVEELAELGGKTENLNPPHTSQIELPRKRIKLFFDGEQILSEALPTCPSSPSCDLPPRQVVPNSPETPPLTNNAQLSVGFTAGEQEGLRYSFRKRNAAQLAPYTADLIQYKRALRHNPDAIVKMKQIEQQLQEEQQYRRPDNHYVDEELGDPLNFPAILQDLSTDEEERQMDAASKAARKILRAKEREQKAREREERNRAKEGMSKRPKPHTPPFPLFDSQPRCNVNSAMKPSTVEAEDDVVRNYFNEVDIEMYDDLLQNEPSPSYALSYPSSPLGLVGVVEDHSEDTPQPSGSKSSDLPYMEGLDLNPKERRALFRMMPAGMAQEALQTAPNRRMDRRSLSPAISVDNDSDGPLLPGQTRVRKATNAKDIQDIRGDSESEEEKQSNPESSSSSPSIISVESDSDSDSVEILHTYRPPPPHDIAIEPEFEQNHSDSDSEGDEDIQFFVQNTKPVKKQTKLRDQNLINYMLPRVHTTGGSKRFTSKFKYDVMTRGSRGHGRERQTLLSFEEHKLRKRRRNSKGEPIVRDSGGHSRSSFGPATSRSNLDALQGIGISSTSTEAHVQDQRHHSKKEKDKIRRAKAKTNGIYNFNSGANTRITTGRRTDAAFFTVDLEDEGFHHALAPTTGTGPRYEPPPPRKRKRSAARSTSANNLSEAQQHGDDHAMDVSGNVKNITCDLGVKRISSGRSFSQGSYIRKGWLYELVNIASSGILDDNTVPPSTILCHFGLNGTMGIGLLCTVLPKILDGLFEGATDILDADSDTLSDEWKPGFRIMSQLISWYLQNAEQGERSSLRDIVDKEVFRIVNLVDKYPLSFVEKPILSLCWFLVELSARVSFPLPTSYPGLSASLKSSSRILMQLLLRVGIQKTVDAIQGDGGLDEVTLVHYATELWVGLIHLLGISREGTPKSKSNPFWTIFMEALPSVNSRDSTHSVKVSEDVWLTTFTLSALSQFSVHGMATAEPRLPAYWDLVAYGLKSICLTETEEQRLLQLPFLRKRDRYVALVVTRCEHLHKIWRWRLDEGSSMFNQISEIFRSRNFANLRFENDKLPKFFKHTNWSLLESHDSTDTVFSIFLKLIMRADGDEVNVARKSAKLKKLLSLAVPLRTLSFPPSRPPGGRELSMFYNRLSAIALALYLDPSDRDERINRARHYLDFATANTKTKHTVICGLERLCHLMIERDMTLGSMLDWIEDLAKVVDAELKVFSSEYSAPCRAKNLTDPRIQLVKHLFETVGRTVASYADASRFFEPLLFGKLKSILASPVLKTDTLRKEFAELLDVIFIARTKVLPKPARPFAPEEINEESQNYFEGFDDIDFAAIDDLPGNDHTAGILEKDRIFRQDVDGKLKWVIYAHLKPYVASSPPPTISWKAYANECDKWLRRWLCFNNVRPSQDSMWQSSIHLLDDLAKDKDNDDPWKQRVNLSIMFQLLQLDPMAYLSFANRALQVFFLALVSDSLTLENEYVSCLLSIDCLRHPLFAGATTVLPARDATLTDYHFSGDQFLELRLPLIRVIFHNIERSLSNEDVAEMEARTSSIDFCHNMFSWMRRVRTQLLQKSGDMGDKTAQYTQFCLQVLQAFQEHPLLRMQHRLEFFLGWARTLAASS